MWCISWLQNKVTKSGSRFNAFNFFVLPSSISFEFSQDYMQFNKLGQLFTATLPPTVSPTEAAPSRDDRNNSKFAAALLISLEEPEHRRLRI